jgi:release factor glutamine methyltransferase
MRLIDAEKRLADVGIEDAAFESRILAEYFLSVPMSRSVFMRYDELDGMDGFDKFLSALEKRETRYPLQYILGEWEFCGLKFKLNESCLIPRPDTEIIVDAACGILNDIIVNDVVKREYRCLDLCTGSGCIAAAVMSRVENAHFTLVDISSGALDMARVNITELGFGGRADFIEADALKEIYHGDEKFDLITANPPYIRADDMPTLEPELSSEPYTALCDGGDGLSFYRAILELYKGRLSDGGAIVFEHGYDQADAVRSLAEAHGMAVRVIKDYGGNDRCTVTAAR